MRVASGEMEGIFACEGALARDVSELIYALPMQGIEQALGRSFNFVGRVGSRYGIELLPMTRLRNLEIGDVTCVGFSQATSEGRHAQPLRPHLLLINTTSTIWSTIDFVCGLRCLRGVKSVVDASNSIQQDQLASA